MIQKKLLFFFLHSTLTVKSNHLKTLILIKCWLLRHCTIENFREVEVVKKQLKIFFRYGFLRVFSCHFLRHAKLQGNQPITSARPTIGRGMKESYARSRAATKASCD